MTQDELNKAIEDIFGKGEYRKVTELNEDELNELKERYATELQDAKGKGISWGELIESHNISNEIIFEYYDGISFVEDDFFCNQE